MRDVSADEFKSTLDKLDHQISRLKTALAAAEAKRDAVRLACEVFDPKPAKRSRRKAPLSIDPDALRGMGLDDALVYIADHNGGVIHSTPAREALVEAGVLKGNNTKQILWEKLSGSERFEQVARGKYRLLDENQAINWAPVGRRLQGRARSA